MLVWVAIDFTPKLRGLILSAEHESIEKGLSQNLICENRNSLAYISGTG